MFLCVHFFSSSFFFGEFLLDYGRDVLLLCLLVANHQARICTLAGEDHRTGNRAEQRFRLVFVSLVCLSRHSLHTMVVDRLPASNVAFFSSRRYFLCFCVILHSCDCFFCQTVFGNNIVYDKHLVYFREAGILVHAKQMVLM